jgi:hypothetical protein
MAYGMLLSGGGSYGAENIDFLLKNILKTISIGINSLFNLYDKIHKNDKTNVSTFFGFKTPNIELKKSIFGFKSKPIKSQTINSQNDLMNEKINMNQNNINESENLVPILTDVGGYYRKRTSRKKTHRKRSIKKRSSRKHKYLR